MRSLLITALLSWPLAAHAQVTTCTTPDFSLQMDLLVDGIALGAPQSPQVFDTAECQCHSTDVKLRIQIDQAITQAKANGSLQVWTGVGCDQALNRSSVPPYCRQMMSVPVTYQDFVTGAAAGTGYLELPVPADALFPNGCAPAMAVNDVYLVFATDNDLSNAETCTYSLAENTQAPNAPAPSLVGVQPTELTVSWPAATGVGEQVPVAYQVLCADANGAPVASMPPARQGYSICQHGHLSRRNDLRFSSDVGVPPLPTTPIGQLTDLDPAYLCSDLLLPTGPTAETTIFGLAPSTSYQILVVGIDRSGNPTASSVITATTAPWSGLSPHGCGCDYSGGTEPASHRIALALLGALFGFLIGRRWLRRR